MDTTSCNPKPPFVKLEDMGQAAVLNYQMPQESTYPASGLVSLQVPNAFFKKSEVTQTTSPSWDLIDELRKRDFNEIRQAVLNQDNLILGTPILEQNLRLEAVRIRNLSNNTLLDQIKEKTSSRRVLEQEKLTTDITETDLIKTRIPRTEVLNPQPLKGGIKKEDMLAAVKSFHLNENVIAQQISQGLMPISITRLSKQNEIKFIPKPKRAEPQISLVLHYKMSSFLGDYGAGQTIKTINLLPGESIKATIRSYVHNESVQAQSQNVLDSFSEYSADELQNTLESITKSSSSHSASSSSNVDSEWNAGGKASLNLGIFSIGGGGGGKGSSNKASSVNSVIQQQTNNLISAVDHHVSGSNSERNISINTETMSTSTTETEELLTRHYHNPNQSCTANYVFRQLLQEYITITFLEDVSIQYYNGFPESRRVVQLSELDLLLEEVLVDEKAMTEVRNQIYRALCNIKDYQQQTVGFIEKVQEELKNCIDTKDRTEVITYIRKKVGLSQTAEGFTVPGIIMNVKKRTLRTDSVVADTLLGQGQALDCYNQRVQSESVKSAELRNTLKEISTKAAEQRNLIALEQWQQEKAQLIQAIEYISQIDDPVERAKLFQNIIPDYCGMPEYNCTYSGDCQCKNNPTEEA